MKNFKKVPVRGITAEELLALWQEGKLYVEQNNVVSPEMLLATCQREAIKYVSAIHDFVSPQWLPYIEDVWQTIISDDEFVDYLMMQKGRTKGQLNRYIVTNIIFYMKALDIYQCDSLLELHKRLEGVKEKNSIYKSAGTYSLRRSQRKRIRELKSFFPV